MSETNKNAAPQWKITLSDLDYGIEEETAVLGVLRSKWLSMGGVTCAFEEEFAGMLGVRHALAISNGTDGLLLGLLALGIGPGDEVIQPAVNFVASANMTIRVGARPVFADIISLEEPTIDPADLERCLTPATRAVVVMHYGGAPCRMDEILAWARARGLAVIEDACHGVGGTYRGRAMGALGDVASFSFFSNKNLAIGEGGMVTTESDEVAAGLRALRSHGMTTLTWDRHRGHASTYDVSVNGLNCRMDELRAALGREQLKKLTRNNDRRRELAREYRRRLVDDAPGAFREQWIVPELGQAGGNAAHHLQVVVASSPEARAAAMDRLRAAGIQTSIHYPFIPGFTAFRDNSQDNSQDNSRDNSRDNYKTNDVIRDDVKQGDGTGRGPGYECLERSAAFCSRVLTLPLHPLLTKDDVRTVAEALIEVNHHK